MRVRKGREKGGRGGIISGWGNGFAQQIDTAFVWSLLIKPLCCSQRVTRQPQIVLVLDFDFDS